MTQPNQPGSGEFDLGDAAFHVFRHAGSGHLGGFILLLLVYIVVNLAFAGGVLWALIPFIENLSLLVDESAPEFEVIWPFLAQVCGVAGLVGLLSWLFYAMMDAALLRWFFGRSPIPRFGVREFQLVIISVLWMIVMALAWAPMAIVLIAGLALESGTVIALGILASLLSLWLMVWFGVKLAPAAALTVYEQRFRFFSAFRLTRGVFWSMLGAFIVAALIYVAASLVLQVISGPLLLAVAGLSFNNLIFVEPETVSDAEVMEALRAFLSRDALIVIGVLVVLSLIPQFLLQASYAGVNAYRVRQRFGDGAPPTELASGAVQAPPPQSEPEPAPQSGAPDAAVAASAAAAGAGAASAANHEAGADAANDDAGADAANDAEAVEDAAEPVESVEPVESAETSERVDPGEGVADARAEEPANVPVEPAEGAGPAPADDGPAAEAETAAGDADEDAGDESEADADVDDGGDAGETRG